MHCVGNINCHTVSFLDFYFIYDSTCSIINTAKSLFYCCKGLTFFLYKGKNGALIFISINFERNADKSACFKLFLQSFYLSLEIVFRL